MAETQKNSRGRLWIAAIIWFLLTVLIAIMIAKSSGGEILAIVLVVVAGITVLLIMSYLANIRDDCRAMTSCLRRIMNSQTRSEALITQMNENLLISENVKSMAFREKDREVVTQAIQAEIRSEKWENAAALIDEMEHCFGNKQEAHALREEIAQNQQATEEEKIVAAIKHVESLWMIHGYVEAEQEVQRLIRIYPTHDGIRELDGKTEFNRLEHKKELLARWDKAVQDNDVEQGVELLKLLDQHLTPTEAAALEESARGVFKAKLHNMGVQFSLFVTEKKWSRALKIGREIIDEYPNSRMAQEVRDKLEVLEKRASEES